MGRSFGWSLWNSVPYLRLLYKVIDPWRDTRGMISIDIYLIWMILGLAVVALGLINDGLMPNILGIVEFYLRLFLSSQMIFMLEEMCIIVSGLSTTKRSQVKRYGKKRRKPPDPWFKRAQRRRQRNCVVLPKKIPTWDGSQEEWDSEWWKSNRHRYLHLCGYQREYERMLQLCPDFDLILSGFVDWRMVEQANYSVDAESVSIDTSVVDSKSVNDALFKFPSAHHVRRNQVPIIFDTGASIGLSPFESDFESWENHNHPLILNGISDQPEVKGAGIVKWTLFDDDGGQHVVRQRAFHVPVSKVRLFSPQIFFKQPEN